MVTIFMQVVMTFVIHITTPLNKVNTTDLKRDRLASSGRGMNSVGSIIDSLETIDRTETSRRWLIIICVDVCLPSSAVKAKM